MIKSRDSILKEVLGEEEFQKVLDTLGEVTLHYCSIGAFSPFLIKEGMYAQKKNKRNH